MDLECGGGTILIFFLTTFSGIEQHLAQGANLIFFIPTCIVSIIINLKNKNIERKIALIVSVSGIAGAIIGANIATNIEVKMLRKYFGIFLISVAIFEIFKIKNNFIKK